MSFHALLSFFLIFPLFGFSFSRQLNDHQTRNLAAWSPYFSVPGDGTTFSLCADEKVEISMAPTSSSVDSNVVCFGDPMLELFDSNGALVASNDNFLGNCPSILYPLNTSAGICENFHVSGRCVSGGCNGTAGIRITTNTCALENVGTAVPGNYPILDCELVLQLRTSICSLEGPWAIVSGGNYRNPCALDGGGYGCNSFSVWRSTQTFVCLNGSTQVPTNPTLSPTIAATYPPAFNRSASDELTFSFSATLAGSESHCETFFIAGDLNYVAVILNFPGARSSSWAADMAIGLSYGENSMQVGGYNSLFPGVGEKIPFPTSWRINQAGIYRVAYDISNYGFNGSALYNLCIMNGWTTSGAVAYSGTVSFSSTPPKGLNISTPPGENNDDNEGGDDEVGGDDDDGSSGGNYKNSFGVVRGDSVDKGILLSFYSDSYSESMKPCSIVGNASDIIAAGPPPQSGLTLMAWRLFSLTSQTYGPWGSFYVLESGTFRYWLMSRETEEAVGFIVQENDPPRYLIYLIGNTLSRRLSVSVPFSYTPLPSLSPRSLSTSISVVGVVEVSNLRQYTSGISDYHLYLIETDIHDW